MKSIRDAEYMEFSHMLGGNIRFCRLRKFRPQKVLAHVIGVTHQNIQKYEAGAIMPTPFRLKKIAEYYNVKVDDLLSPTFIHEQTKANEPLDRSIHDSN
jgi:transcriptional regulator with XRE-family HTH domain|tara:strand:- start:475 stop:771 length:297 start_codon:yes stop_codon:yes gene_type:complete